jgi:hypothetical protein
VTGLRRLHLEELCSGAPHVLQLELPAKQQLTALHLALHAYLPALQVGGVPGEARTRRRALSAPARPARRALQRPPAPARPRPPQKHIHDLSPLSRLVGLQQLTLQGTAITVNPQTLPHLAPLSALTKLHLLCSMEDLGPGHFQPVLSRLGALADLSLPYVEVEARVWGALCALPRLQRLSCGTLRLAAEDAAQGPAGPAQQPGLPGSASLRQLELFEARLGGSLRWRALAPALRSLQMRMCYTTGHMAALAGHACLEVRGRRNLTS